MSLTKTESLANRDFGLIEKDGKIICDSIHVAKVFGKRHSDVLRDIEKISDDFSKVSQRNFALSNFIFETYETRGKIYPRYFLTRDGFTKLVFGYNGEKAIKYQIAYLNQFNEMERRLMRIQAETQTAEWSQARQQSKQVRLQETDAIKSLIEYAKAQGSQNADKLYVVYSKLVKELIEYDNRDMTSVDTLTEILTFERLLFGIITSEMLINTHYKEIYRRAKSQLSEIKRLWAIPALTA